MYTFSSEGRGSSAGTGTGYRLDGPDSIPGSARDFSILHIVQTVSGAYRTYPKETGGDFRRG
jgi:hypothetical protein